MAYFREDFVCIRVSVCMHACIYTHFFNALIFWSQTVSSHLRTGCSFLLFILHCHCYWHCYNLYSYDYQSVEADMSRRTGWAQELLLEWDKQTTNKKTFRFSSSPKCMIHIWVILMKWMKFPFTKTEMKIKLFLI